MMDKTLHDRIRARLEALGMKAEAASRAAGLDKTYLRKLFDRPGAVPRADKLAALAAVLQTTTRELLGERPEFTVADVPPPPTRRAADDVPLYGTVAGAHLRGAFLMSNDPVDFVGRPPALAAARDIYAIYVEGTSMVPEHNPGDLRFVHPHRPPRPGDSVVVQVRAGTEAEVEATIGRYRRTTAEAVVIEKHNPAATVEFKRSTVISVHKVLTQNEMFGG